MPSRKKSNNKIDIGKKLENEVIDYLYSRNRIFKHNVKVKTSDKLYLEIDIVGPYFIIEIKNSSYNPDHTYIDNAIDDLICQIKRQLDLLPNTHKLYLYLPNYIGNDDITRKIQFNDRIKIIRNLDDIEYNDLDIVIDSPNALKTIALLDDTEMNKFLLKYNTLTVKKDTYYNTIIYLTDSELQQLNKLTIKIVDEYPQSYLFITQNRRKDLPYKRDTIFTIFQDTIIYKKPRNEFPIRHIDGYTSICSNCNEIYKKFFVNNGICFKCSNINVNHLIKSNK